MARKEKINIGRRYGQLTVLEEVEPKITISPTSGYKITHRKILCECDCGTTGIYFLSNLRKGCTKSCGCERDKQSKKRLKGNKNSLVHGHTWNGGYASPTYRSWHNMRQRCKNPNTPKYSYYGGRGITVCDRWNTFTNFLEDMGERPEGTSIDRINPNGNYEPTNCRWSTWVEQNNNQQRHYSG